MTKAFVGPTTLQFSSAAVTASSKIEGKRRRNSDRDVVVACLVCVSDEPFPNDRAFAKGH